LDYANRKTLPCRVAELTPNNSDESPFARKVVGLKVRGRPKMSVLVPLAVCKGRARRGRCRSLRGVAQDRAFDIVSWFAL